MKRAYYINPYQKQASILFSLPNIVIQKKSFYHANTFPPQCVVSEQNQLAYIEEQSKQFVFHTALPLM